MIGPEPEDAHSRRLSSLAKKLCNKRYRDGYLSSHTRMFLANQLVSLQGEMSQKEFGELLGKAQPIISRLQNPDYGKYTLQTLLDIASKLNIALIVRFVDFPTFINFTSDFSDEALRPTQFDSLNPNSGGALMNELADRLKKEFSDKEYRHAYVDEFLNSYIATQIKVLREQRGWNQEKLAQEAGMKQSRISVLEDVNYYSWSLSTLKKLAKAFDVPLNVSFGTFGDRLIDIQTFSREWLERCAFDEDPLFHEEKSKQDNI